MFTCENNLPRNASPDATPFSFSTVFITPIKGVRCGSDPVISVGYARVCAKKNPITNVTNDFELRPTSDALLSCPASDSVTTTERKFVFCQQRNSCSDGKYPCESNIIVPQLTAYDYLNDEECQNFDEGKYEPMTTSQAWSQIRSIFSDLNSSEAALRQSWNSNR
jgi:hypothetical protein